VKLGAPDGFADVFIETNARRQLNVNRRAASRKSHESDSSLRPPPSNDRRGGVSINLWHLEVQQHQARFQRFLREYRLGAVVDCLSTETPEPEHLNEGVGCVPVVVDNQYSAAPAEVKQVCQRCLAAKSSPMVAVISPVQASASSSSLRTVCRLTLKPEPRPAVRKRLPASSEFALVVPATPAFAPASAAPAPPCRVWNCEPSGTFRSVPP